MEHRNHKHFAKGENPGDKISKTFCALPWASLHHWPDGRVYPCCLTDYRKPIGHVKKNTLEELWNVDRMKELRKDKLEGERHVHCAKCYMQEDNGDESMRIASNRLLEEHLDNFVATTEEDGHSNEFILRYWDFRFSNLCNFKCRMCGSSLSSKWYKDEVDIYGQSENDRALIHVNDWSKKNIHEYVHEFIEEVEEIYFAGGEPLMMEEHYMILEKLIEIGNTDTRIRYNTNFSVLKFKKWDVLELWSHFTKHDPLNVRIFASLDAMGEVAEYSRSGTNWKQIEENVRTVLDKGFYFDLSCTVSILNIFEIPDFVDRMVELGVPWHGIHLNNVLTFPRYYALDTLPPDLKAKAKDNLYNHLRKVPEFFKVQMKHKYDIIIKYFELEKGDVDKSAENQEMKHIVSLVDKHRKESFTKVYPHYKDWFESIPDKHPIGTTNI